MSCGAGGRIFAANTGCCDTFHNLSFKQAAFLPACAVRDCASAAALRAYLAMSLSRQYGLPATHLCSIMSLFSLHPPVPTLRTRANLLVTSASDVLDMNLPRMAAAIALSPSLSVRRVKH